MSLLLCRTLSHSVLWFASLSTLSLAQTATLGLGSGTTVPGGSASLNLVLSGGAQPAGLQWTFSYAASDFTSVSVVAGPAATGASKTVDCYGSAGIYTCVLTGMTSATVGDGTVATATFSTSGSATTSRPIQLTGMGASLNGSLLPVTPISGGITVVLPPVTPSLLSCSPASITGSGTTNCTVTLSGVAPSGGSTVTLNSDQSAVTVPASVMVAAGAATASFTATISSLTSDGAATLTATANSVSAKFTLGLTALPRISGLSCSPASLTSGGTSTCTVTLTKAALSGGQAVTLTSNNPALTVPSSITLPSGTTTATFTATAGTVATAGSATVSASANGSSATSIVNLTVPIQVSSLGCAPASVVAPGTATCTVTMTGPVPSGGLSVTLSSNQAAAAVPASITVLAGASTASFTTMVASLTSDATAVLTATGNGASATFSLNLLAPPLVSALACTPATLTSGATASCTVNLNKAALSGGQVVALDSTDSNLNTPASVTVSAGNMTTQFSAVAGTVPNNCSAILRASANGTTASSTINLVAPVEISSIACSPMSIVTPGTSVCTVTLTGAAPSGGLPISMASSNANVTVPSSVTVPAGSTAASATLTAALVSSDQPANLTVTSGGKSVSATLNLIAPPQVSSVSCAPTQVPSNGTSACSVTLTKATTSAVAVSLASDTTSLTVPSSAVVAAGTSSAAFTATAGAVTAVQNAAVIASANGISKTVSLSVLPVATCPCSIWGPTTVPTTPAVSDTANTELGMRFRSKVAGYVIGVRYYKGPGNLGTHAARLWTNSGTRLATIQASTETASGWQEIDFKTPVKIAANTTYVVSYRAAKGHYSSDPLFFRNSGVESGPLYALRDGEDGASGVFKYGTAVFPTNTDQSTNYWVDLVFNTTPSMTPTPVPYGASSLLTSQTVSPADDASLTATQPAPQTTLTCPKSVHAGDSFACELSGFGASSQTELTASTSDVRIPAVVAGREGQRSLKFQGVVQETARQSSIVISARTGEGAAEDRITVLPALAPLWSAPETALVKSGEPVNFTVMARDANGLAVPVSASELPVGASFRSEIGQFEWVPARNQEGEYTLTFRATSTSGSTSSRQTRIMVGSGQPVLAHSSQISCSAGAIASLRGGWLSSSGDEISDPTGNSRGLGGTTIRVNGIPVPVLSVSPERVDFLCPAVTAGQPIRVTVETTAGMTAPVESAALEANPTLLLAEDHADGQGAITSVTSNRLAASRSSDDDGEPVQANDTVWIRATGIRTTDTVFAQIGGIDAPVLSVVPASDAAGVVLIQARIPVAAPPSGATAVRIEALASGHRFPSNTVTLAIE